VYFLEAGSVTSMLPEKPRRRRRRRRPERLGCDILCSPRFCSVRVGPLVEVAHSPRPRIYLHSLPALSLGERIDAEESTEGQLGRAHVEEILKY
jgi:hypothetical protein